MPDGWFLTYRLILTLQKNLAEIFGTFKTSPYLCNVKNHLGGTKEVREPPHKRHFLCPNMNEDLSSKNMTAPRGRSSEHAKAPKGLA